MSEFACVYACFYKQYRNQFITNPKIQSEIKANTFANVENSRQQVVSCVLLNLIYFLFHITAVGPPGLTRTVCHVRFANSFMDARSVFSHISVLIYRFCNRVLFILNFRFLYCNYLFCIFLHILIISTWILSKAELSIFFVRKKKHCSAFVLVWIRVFLFFYRVNYFFIFNFFFC